MLSMTNTNLSGYILEIQSILNLLVSCSVRVGMIKTNKISIYMQYTLVKENRIYIVVEFTRKKCKTAILLYCFHTAGVLHIFALYNLLGPET